MAGELVEMVAAPGARIRRIAILGTGLIGASVGLGLRAAGYTGAILGWDPEPTMLAEARSLGAVDSVVAGEADEDPFVCALAADLVVLAGPVLSIAEWLEQLAPVLSPSQLVTDVGSVKGFLVERAGALYNGENQPGWLPGHPMAGREQSGAAHAQATLFKGAAWLLTGTAAGSEAHAREHRYTAEWLGWVERLGAHPVRLTPERHDLLCASVSHLPQMLASSLAAMLQQQFGGADADSKALAQPGALGSIGGRALREMTRLGASPYSMWRDIAITNEAAISAALLRLEQEIQHLRENLRTPELREIFAEANTFGAMLSKS